MLIPFISTATVYGVVKPCLPIFTTVLGIAVKPKYAFDKLTSACASLPLVFWFGIPGPVLPLVSFPALNEANPPSAWEPTINLELN